MNSKFFILVILIFQNTAAQFTNTEVVAKIKTETSNNMISVVGTATNTTEVYKSLKYSMSVFKTDANNNVSKSSQEGRFTLEANESKELSKGIVSIEESKKMIILLLVYEEDVIVGKARLAFNEQIFQKSNKAEDLLEDGIELKGIVVEETKTKPGRDFFEFFYTSYNLNQINGNKVVEVFEKLSFGRSTIIQVKIEDNIVHEFIGKPDLEYLEQMSEIAIREVHKYFNNLKKQKKDIFQY